MESIQIHKDLPNASVISLGTWAIGGWLWGGTDKKDSIATIHKAFDMGINIIDTAPVYGFGKAEELVGDALRDLPRDKVLIATKVGLQWLENNKVVRNCTKARLVQELDDSLRRLGTDYIDVYQVHWPDTLVPFEETAEAMNSFLTSGKVRAIGVSNYSIDQMERFKTKCDIHTTQPPYNIFERDIEKEILPYSKKNKMTTLAYGALCRGLLSGRMRKDTKFEGDDLRNVDPKFQQPRYEEYLRAVDNLNTYAQTRFKQNVLTLAVRWVIDRGQTIALWGARNPDQLLPAAEVMKFKLTTEDYVNIHKIVSDSLSDPIGPEFMAPPLRKA